MLLSTIHKLNVGKQRTQGYLKAMKAAGFRLRFGVGRTAGRCRDGRLFKSHPVDAIIALDTDASLAAIKSGENFWKSKFQRMWRLLVMLVSVWHTTLRQN